KSGSNVPTGATRYVYDEAGHLIGEYDQSGNAIEETVYLGDTPVATVKNGTPYYIYADQIDTPRVITDINNLMVWRWDQADPFGATLPDENPTSLGSFTYNLRFPGQIYDQETGKHYNANRDYDPATGKYIQSDPIGLRGGSPSTYAYVDGNPLRYTDASGLCPWCIILGLLEIGLIANEVATSDVPMIGGNLGGAVVRTVERSAAREVAQSCAAPARGGVYVLRNIEGDIVRSGRSKNLARRETEHARDPRLSDYTFEAAARTDVYAEQRGLEQMLHDTYDPILNRIRPISLNNKKIDAYMEAAREYMKRLAQ
ncbi:RHS repeat-associated core domain-containing protein, partial [Ralstonia pseudosolanacearum]